MRPRGSGWNQRHRWGPPANWENMDPDVMARRRQMGRRFGCIFVGFAVFFTLLVVGVLVLLWNSWSTGDGYASFLLIICGVPLALMIAGTVTNSVYRRVASPMVDIMAAADAVAGGDLTVRVPERSGGDIGRLAARFNNMTATLEQAEQQRRNLTADVAHELRTPLHIIQGNLEGVLDGVYEPTADHIRATLDEAQVLGRLVNDLQLLSLAEAGQLTLHRSPVLAADLLADVATRFAAQSAEANVSLTVEVAEKALTVYVDPDRLEQVLSNLVANALRYTLAGGTITLAAARAGRSLKSVSFERDEVIELTVADTGTGIPADELAHIFDRFWRGDKARTRDSRSGSGLGLAIARQLVLAHGGQISAESKVGVGTVVTISLPDTAESQSIGGVIGAI